MRNAEDTEDLAFVPYEMSDMGTPYTWIHEFGTKGGNWDSWITDYDEGFIYVRFRTKPNTYGIINGNIGGNLNLWKITSNDPVSPIKVASFVVTDGNSIKVNLPNRPAVSELSLTSFNEVITNYDKYVISRDVIAEAGSYVLYFCTY